eukprot:gene23465-17292_t
MKRTFGRPESEVRIKLYRDHAAWCPYCHKVWLQLEEKKIPYVIEKVPMNCYGQKPASFLTKNPRGLLPVIEFDGRMVTESNAIMNLLEDQFPDNNPLMPPAGTPERTHGTPERNRAEQLMRLERNGPFYNDDEGDDEFPDNNPFMPPAGRIFSDWMGWLTSDWDNSGNMSRFESTLDIVDQQMGAAGGPFFMGSALSLVDITFTPMIERMCASLAYYKGFHMRGSGRWPNVESWFNAMEQRPAYIGTRGDYYTHATPNRNNVCCAMVPEGRPVSLAVDGRDGDSWSLPLSPLTATSMPEPYAPGENPPADRVEAAVRLIRNHGPVARFALRGPGKPGRPPLSLHRLIHPTPYLTLRYGGTMDVALPAFDPPARWLGLRKQRTTGHALKATSGSSGPMPSAPIIDACAYLRDRVGVPRDMRFPAARQLRAHINWAIDIMNVFEFAVVPDVFEFAVVEADQAKAESSKVVNESSGLVSTTDKDYLEQDESIRGQRFACISFVSPEDVLVQKETFVLSRFLSDLCKDVDIMLTNVTTLHGGGQDSLEESVRLIRERYAYMWSESSMQDELNAYRLSRESTLDQEFRETTGDLSKTSIRGFKIRGVYGSLDEAKNRAKVISRTDNKFNVYIAEVGCWCPWSPNPDDITDCEYSETQLNTLMKNYYKQQETRTEMYDARKSGLIERIQDQRDTWLDKQTETPNDSTNPFGGAPDAQGGAPDAQGGAPDVEGGSLIDVDFPPVPGVEDAIKI